MLDSLHPESTPNIHHLSLESPEQEFDIEKELRLREQYDSQINILRQNNLLETLSTGELGIKAINNQEYAIPSYDQVKASLEAQRELLTTKTKQGFTKLLLVPFGLKLQTQIDAYGNALKQHHAQGKLLRAKLHPSDPDEPANLNTTTPVWRSEGYNKADNDNNLVYNPTSFTLNNHGGQTKSQLLDSIQSTNTATKPGWQIFLVEERPDIPRQGQGQTLHNRPQLEAGQTPNDYLNALQTNPTYNGESGLTPEAWLTLALTNLQETNQVLDDWQGKGSVAYLTGAYFPSSGDVPDSCWSRDDSRVYLDGYNPDFRDNNFGARSSVRVPVVSSDIQSSTSLFSSSSDVPPFPEVRKF